MKNRGSNFTITRSVIIALDIFIAILIILTANKIALATLGKFALIFGFIMITIITALRLTKKI